jgi:hypothetical protein
MEGVLKDAGIPALIRRGAGFDTPDFLPASLRDVLVPESALEEVRQLLEDATGSWVP